MKGRRRKRAPLRRGARERAKPEGWKGRRRARKRDGSRSGAGVRWGGAIRERRPWRASCVPCRVSNKGVARHHPRSRGLGERET